MNDKQQPAINSEALLTTLTKEYEGLRKEIDARTDATKAYGWPVVLLVFTVIASWKTNIDWNLVLLFIPAIGMTIVALAANASHDIMKARRALALTENKIYTLTGQPILSHESWRVSVWRKRWWRGFPRAVAISAAYVLGECLLFFWSLPRHTVSFREVKPASYPERAIVLFLVLLTPVGIYLYNSRGSDRLISESLDTCLIKQIRLNPQVREKLTVPHKHVPVAKETPRL